MRVLGVSLRGAAAAAALLLSSAAFSQSFTIADGQAFTGNLILTGPDDIGTITSGGSITAQVDGVDAIDMADDNQQLEIQWGGVLLQEGNQAAAVMSTGFNARIENFGTIRTTGDAAHAIVSLGDNAVINNYGAIETGGRAAAGLIVAGADGNSRNMGSVRVAGEAAIGVIQDCSGCWFENLGTIQSAGLASTGLIVGSNGAGTAITNSGSIISPLDGTSAAMSISPDADGVTLNLLSGSVIQGAINFAGTNGTVNVANGMNTALQFNLLNPVDLNTFGSPFVTTADNLLAVVDPTGFSAHDEMLADVTRATTNMLDERLAERRMAQGNGDKVWFSAIGGYRRAESSGPGVGFDHLFNGLLIGADRPVRYATRAGIFGGGTLGRMGTDTDSQTIDMQNYVVGGYANFANAGTSFDFAMAAAVTNFESDRRVANNLVAGGIEHAEADYFGTTLSPSLTVSRDIPAGNTVLTPSVRLRYAALFVESYAERGSTANLAVDGRRIDALEMRGQLSASAMPYELFGGTMTHALRLGAEGYFTDGQGVDATLLGQALNFEASGPDTGIRGFAGFETRYATAGGWQIGSQLEFGYDTSGSFTSSGSVKLDIPF